MSASQTPSTLHPVKVDIREIGNRTLKASVRDHVLLIDQPKEFGADDKGATPPERLAIAFGTCIVSTLQLVAVQQGIVVDDIKVTVEGTVDFAKALNINATNRAGFPELTASISFSSPISDTDKQKLLERVAAVGAPLDNIENGTPVKYKLV